MPYRQVQDPNDPSGKTVIWEFVPDAQPTEDTAGGTAPGLPPGVTPLGEGTLPKPKILPPNFGPLGGATASPFGPDQNLIGQQLTPQASPDTAAARAGVSSSLGALQGPDRGQLAAQTFEQLTSATNPAYEQSLRAVGQKASAYGRLNSGLTTNELGDVAATRNRDIGNLGAQLATQSAGQTLQDRLNTLGAGQNVLGQLSGLDQQQYGNLTGERGYQAGLSQQAFNNDLSQNSLLAALLGGNPGAGITGISNQYGQQGQGNMNTGGDILNYILQNGWKPKQPVSQYTYT